MSSAGLQGSWLDAYVAPSGVSAGAAAPACLVFAAKNSNLTPVTFITAATTPVTIPAPTFSTAYVAPSAGKLSVNAGGVWLSDGVGGNLTLTMSYKIGAGAVTTWSSVVTATQSNSAGLAIGGGQGVSIAGGDLAVAAGDSVVITFTIQSSVAPTSATSLSINYFGALGWFQPGP